MTKKAIVVKKQEQKIDERELQAILHGYTEDDHYHFEFGFVPDPFSYIILGQARKTFNEIEELSEDIARHELIHPISIARFTRQYAQAYIKMNNDLWGLHNRLPSKPSIVVDGISYWDILIAGGRRTRALRHLWDHGCSGCEAKYGQKRGKKIPKDQWIEKCRHKHFSKGVAVSIGVNIPPAAAVNRQFSENIHNTLTPEEEAMGHVLWLGYLKNRFGKRITMTVFAKAVGRGEGRVRDSVDFGLAPDRIREMAIASRKDPKAPRCPFGFVILGVKMQKAFNYTEEESIRNFDLMMHAGYNLNLEKCKAYVNGIIINSKAPQKTLMELMEETSQMQMAKDNRRIVAQDNLLRSARHGVNYIRAIVDMLNRGVLDKPNSPFSMNSVVEQFMRMVALMEESLPHVINQLPRAKQEITAWEIAETIAQMHIALERLDEEQLMALAKEEEERLRKDRDRRKAKKA